MRQFFRSDGFRLACYLLLLATCTLFTACGPSEAEKKSARQLDAVARQLDAACRNWQSGRVLELNQIDYRRFFDEHFDRIGEVRTELAKAETVERHERARLYLDSLVATARELVESRRFVVRQSGEMQDSDYGPLGPSKREMMTTMMRAFGNTHDSLQTAGRRQLDVYNRIVGSTLLSDSINHYNRILTLSEKLKEGVENARQVELD